VGKDPLPYTVNVPAVPDVPFGNGVVNGRVVTPYCTVCALAMTNRWFTSLFPVFEAPLSMK
jgi:hypothetical protein